MKTLKYTFILVGLFNLSYSQTIKPLSAYYTEPQNTTVSDIISPVIYYKDMANYFTPFIGNWKYTNGNKTFVVTLWKETKKPTYFDFDINSGVAYYSDEIFGHYDLFQDYGLSTQQLIYSSQMTVITDPNNIRRTEISGKVITSNKLTGWIWDNIGINTNHFVDGTLDMNINPNTNPLTATWKVIANESLDPNSSRTFVIPTNVTLTKF